MLHWFMVEIKVKRLNTFNEKSKGLLGTRSTKGIYFETRFGIHTFFMKYPIVVAILDNEGVIVSVKKVMPNRILLWSPIYSRVLELPEGYLNKPDFKVGEKVLLRFDSA